MWHSCAYQASIAGATNAAAVAAVPDNVFKIGSQNGFVLQEDMMLIGAYAGGVGVRAPILKSPKLNQFNPLFISPQSLTEAVANGELQSLWPYRPFTFRNQEEVTAFSDNTDAGAQDRSIITDFSNGIDQIPIGEELFVGFTSTTTATAHAWTLLTYTLTQALPEGIYALVSSECQSTTAVYHRYTFWGQFYRPGFLSAVAFTNPQSRAVQSLQKGLAGQFSNVTLPNVEVYCSGADTAHTGFMRVIKVA